MTINYHHNRRPKNFLVRKVRESLPEYYTSEFPKLVSFLENYYEFLDDSIGASSFDDNVRQLFAQRDVHAAETQSLNSIISEITGGLPNGDNFTDARFYATRLAELAKNKGTRFAAEEFFRAFFQQEVTISYPKDDIFVIGPGPYPGVAVDSSDASVSLIGVDGGKVLQNYRLYQIYSILIKSGLSVDTWRELYKKFVHPAGWYFQGEVEIVGEGNLALNFTDLPGEQDSVSTPVIGEALLSPVAPFVQMTALFDSGARSYRASLDDLVSKYQDFRVFELNNIYGTVDKVITPNSFTFDNNRRRRVFDIASDEINFSATNGYDRNNPTLRLVGTISEWNNHKGTADSNFGAYSNAPNSGVSMGTMSTTDSTGFISENTTVMVTANLNDSTTGAPGENYYRHYTTKHKVDLTGVEYLNYWVNRAKSGQWGNEPQGNNPGESLRFNFGQKIDDSTGEITSPSRLDSAGPAEIQFGPNTWVNRNIYIKNIADSNVFLEFSQAGNQFGDVKDNWAFTNVYALTAYDSDGPDMSLETETMDNEMFTRYTSDSSF